MRLLALLLVFAAAGVAVAAAQERAASGPVEATVDRDLRLVITRGGTPVHDGPVGFDGCQNDPCPLELDRLTVRDLDGDEEPEVVVDLFTGGAHCCWVSRVFHRSGQGYRVTQRDWADARYRLRGGRRFDAADTRFAYVFADYAHSVLPVQSFTFRDGRFRDATRGTRYLRDHASTLRREYERQTRRRGARYDARPLLAALTAELRLLRRAAEAERLLGRALDAGQLRRRGGEDPVRGDRAFIRDLDRFLKRLRYPS